MTDPIFGEVIHTYSRAQAIEDGVLVDVSETAREAGIKFPVAVTRRVWDELVTPDPRSVESMGQSIRGRLWDTLWMLFVAARMSGNKSMFHYKVIYILKKAQRRTVTLKAVCGPGDDAAPVITVMFPDED